MSNILTLIEQIMAELPSSEKKIAEYVLKEPISAVEMGICEFSSKVGACSTSVVRFCKRLGFDGYVEFKESMLWALVEKYSANSDDYQADQVMENFCDGYESSKDLISKYIRYAKRNFTNLESILNSQNLQEAAKLVYQADTILLIGCGASVVTVDDIQYKMLGLGKNVLYSKDPNFQVVQVRIAPKNSVAIAVSYFGEDKDVNTVVEEVKKQGIKLITITKIGHNHLTKLSDIKLQVPACGYEDQVGSTLNRILMIAVSDILYSAVRGLLSPEERRKVRELWKDRIERVMERK